MCLPGLAAARAQEPNGASQPAGPPVTRPADREDLAGSLLDSPPPRIIHPRGYRPPPPAGPPLPESGSHLVDGRGHLLKLQAADWYVLRLEPSGNEPAAPPRLLLPNQLLEQIEPLADRQPAVVLTVSGETTVYRGRSFLFLREVVIGAGGTPLPPAGWADANRAGADANAAGMPTRLIDLAGEEQVPDGPPPQDSQVPSTGPAEPSSAPDSPPGDGAAPTPDDILRQLSRERPGRAVSVTLMSPTSQAAPSPSGAPPAAEGLLAPGRGTMVVDRVVRIFPEEPDGWWAIHFEGDNTLREPPIRLLPCPLLEQAERRANPRAPRPVKFRVSGEISRYKGRRYLLLRKLLPEHDLGQL